MKAIEINVAANGYMLRQSPSKEDPMGFLQEKKGGPYVFETFMGLMIWIKHNLDKPLEGRSAPAPPKSTECPYVGMDNFEDRKHCFINGSCVFCKAPENG